MRSRLNETICECIEADQMELLPISHIISHNITPESETTTSERCGRGQKRPTDAAMASGTDLKSDEWTKKERGRVC